MAAHTTDQGESRVKDALRAIPRRDFLPPQEQPYAAEDRPLPIGHGQTNSQPSTVATMLWLLDVREGQHILDVGAGSGWTTALLGWLVGPTGRVVGVELEPDLAQQAARNVAATAQPWATVEVAAPGLLGDPAQGPYDRILVSAMAPDLPQALINQMAADSVLVAPVNGRLTRLRRSGRDATTERFGHYRFVPLR